MLHTNLDLSRSAGVLGAGWNRQGQAWSEKRPKRTLVCAEAAKQQGSAAALTRGGCVQSIVDRRYERQKHFMLRCGLRRLMYLVEGDPLRHLASIPVRKQPPCWQLHAMHWSLLHAVRSFLQECRQPCFRHHRQCLDTAWNA